MANITDLQSRAKAKGKKSASAKRGINHFFTPMPESHSPNLDGESTEASSVEKLIAEKRKLNIDVPSSKTSTDNSEVERLKRQLEAERKERIKLERVNKPKSNIPTINTASGTDLHTIINEEKISFKAIHTLLTTMTKLTSSEQKVYSKILEETSFGQLINVPIDRKSFEQTKVQKNEISSAIEKLSKAGYFSYLMGRRPGSTRTTRFFSLKSNFK